MCRFLLIPCALGLLLSWGEAAEQVAPGPAARDETADFLKDREAAQRALWVRRTDEEKMWLAHTLALSPAQEATLARLGDEALQKAMAEWRAAAALLVEDIRHDKDLQDGPPIKVLMENWNPMLVNRVFGQYRAPAEQPAWREGLAGLLTPAQTEAWRKQAPGRVAAFLKPFLEQVRSTEEDNREPAAALLDLETRNLHTTFGLNEAQMEKLKALRERLVDRSLAEWRTAAAWSLADQPPEELGGLDINFSDPEPQPASPHDPAWIEGLRKILDARAWQTVADSLKARQARRPAVLAQMLILAVDDEVRCSARQREQLRPLAERWVQAKPLLFQAHHRDGLTRLTFLAAAARASTDELASVLEESQIRNWRRLCIPGILDEMGALVLRPVRGRAPAEPPLQAFADHGFESLWQAFFLRAEARVRSRCLARAVGRAQEIGRVCALPEETRTLLETAARGAVEASLREWRSVAENSAREQIEEIEERNPEVLRVQLEQLDSSGALDEMQTPPDKQPVWTRTLKKVMQGLPSPKALAWWQEEAAHVTFKRQAIVRFLLEEFGQLVYLIPEQLPKLEALLEETLKAHTEVLEQRNSGSDAPWYLSTPENLAPFNFIPEATLRPLLTAQQWSGWSKSEAYSEPEGKK